jgi:hypothetical protein
MDIGASPGKLPSKVSYSLRQDKQLAVNLPVYEIKLPVYEIKLPHDCRTVAKYKHNLGHSKGLKNMVTKYAGISS